MMSLRFLIHATVNEGEALKLSGPHGHTQASLSAVHPCFILKRIVKMLAFPINLYYQMIHQNCQKIK